jgi:2-polyprenyl-3-methyl-5-hydroxy-6-metoxy-1,4-benzoquinol methylase
LPGRQTETPMASEAQDESGLRYTHPWPPSFLAQVPSGKKVLDVGCNRGGLGVALKEADPGREVWGIEPTEAADHAAAVLYKAVRGFFPADVPGDWSDFDVITFVDVLEHIPDPWEALRATRSLLAPTGRVLALIPNIRCIQVSLELLLRGEWHYDDVGLLDRTHLRFFTRRSIEEIFDDCGLRIRLIRPWNREFVNSRPARFLKLFGHRFDDLTSLHFIVVAERG